MGMGRLCLTVVATGLAVKISVVVLGLNFFAAFVGALAFFMSLPLPPSKEDFFGEFGGTLWGCQQNALRAGHRLPSYGILYNLMRWGCAVHP